MPRLLLCALLLLLGCDDTTDPPDPEPDAGAGLTIVAQTDPAWMGVWSDGDTVYTAGGTASSGAIGRIADGALTIEPTPDGPHLWWVFGTDADHVWACGDGGRILRRQPDGTWAAETTDVPPETVLWGLWGSNSSDLWAVGGTNANGGPRGVVLRSAGDGVWSRVTDPALPLEDPADEFAGLNLYKVWGSTPDAVHLVGEGGAAIRWDGQAFTTLSTDTNAVIFTAHGQSGGPTLAVGGLAESVVRRLDGDAWIDDGAPAGLPLNGVFVRPDGSAWVSGARGLLMRRDADGNWARLRAPEGAGARTLHAVWAAGDVVWSVGGDLVGLQDGLIVNSAGVALEVR